MSNLELYQTPTNFPRESTTDGWVSVFADIVKLAEYVSDSEFVPEALRRRPAAVAAAILTGREMGLPPMTALRHLHVIRGKVGQSAELMRAQVYRAGHEIRDVEVTDNRCIVEGRRRGETEWTRATFSETDAKKARIDLGGYPKDKLYARATSRLCKRKFSDAIAGLPTVDDLEDGYEGEVVEIPIRDAAAVDSRAVQRKPRQRKPAGEGLTPGKSGEPTGGDGMPPPSSAAEIVEPASDLDEFPSASGHGGGNDASQGVKPSLDADQESDSHDQNTPDEPPTAPMNRKMHALFRDAGLTDRDDRLAVTSMILGYQIDTSAHLTKSEASRLIDKLEEWAQNGELGDMVNEILNRAALAAENQKGTTDE